MIIKLVFLLSTDVRQMFYELFILTLTGICNHELKMNENISHVITIVLFWTDEALLCLQISLLRVL